MKFFVGSSVGFIILAYFVYRYYLAGIDNPVNNGLSKERNIKRWQIIAVFVAGFILRIIISCRNSSQGYHGFPSDISCFTAWSKLAFEQGLSNFYASEMFTDYPPGFVYIFWLLGATSKLLHLQEGTSAFVVLIKLPAIAADVGIAYLAFRLAQEMKINKFGSLGISLLILLNPLVLIDSAVWGQTDSVFVLLLVVVMYLFYRNNTIPAYFIYGFSILVKPQALMFAPVIVFAYINELLKSYKDKKRFTKTLMVQTGAGLGAIALVFLLMLPFGIGDALKQYTDTVTSYPYGSVNAYNFWGLMGKIWIGQDELFLGLSMKFWGTCSIIVTYLASAFIFIKCRKSRSVYFYLSAFIMICIFTFSVRMHERYIYPAAVFLLFAFILRPRLETFILFVSTSLVSFFNAYHVLYYYDPQNFDRHNRVIMTVCVFELLVFAYLVYTTVRLFARTESPFKEKEHLAKMISDNASYWTRRDNDRRSFTHSVIVATMNKRDYIIVSVIMVVYSCVAFFHLGNMSAPTTEYSIVKEGNVYIDLGADHNIREMWTYLGHEFNQKYTVKYTSDNETWYSLFTEDNPWDTGSVYNWNKTEVDFVARYLYIAPIEANKADAIIEMVFKDGEGNIITPVNTDKYHNLFDEQEYAVTEDTYMNGTYFDEVHYTRHVYEMKNGLYCYENTHPQLGKEIMAIGTMIFGMNPFGWRFSGTVCGIIMIFAMYVFAKKFFDSTKLATLTTIVFSADFMHFVQSRIATIDVYAVLFIMISYIFMYEYTQYNFFDVPLSKTYKPLFWCGFFMALAISSKWIGVYSALGLAVILFASFFHRYREFNNSLHRFEQKMEPGDDFNVVRSFNRKLVLTVAWCFLVFIFIPLIIYTLTYIPFNDGVEGRGLITKMLEAQKLMFNYHTNITSTHPYSSEWYQWPVMYKPVLFVYEPITDSLRRVIVLLGNPAIWWLGIPASLYMVYLWIDRKDRKAAFLMIGYLAQYLPWILVSRYVFIYHYFASVPFITVMCIYALTDIGKRFPKFRKAVYVYVAVAVLLFILFLPILNGSEVSVDYITHFVKWSPGWAM